jgi:hypothetical protein
MSRIYNYFTWRGVEDDKRGWPGRADFFKIRGQIGWSKNQVFGSQISGIP